MNRSGLLEAAARMMPEAELLDGVLGTPGRPGIALAYRWRGYHTHRSQHSPAGFPDVVLVHAPARRLVFAELKRQANRYQPTPEQVGWLEDLRELMLTPAERDLDLPSVEVYLWRPLDLLDGTIASILAPTYRAPC